MTKGRLYAMIGVARSGKSTIAEQWKNNKIDIVNYTYYPTNNLLLMPRVVVCADQIRLALHGERYIEKAEVFVHAIKNIMIISLLNSGHDVLVDGTHTTESSIKELLRIDVDCEFCIIKTPIDICIERAIKTNQEDLIPIINRMASQISTIYPLRIEELRINTCLTMRTTKK